MKVWIVMLIMSGMFGWGGHGVWNAHHSQRPNRMCAVRYLNGEPIRTCMFKPYVKPTPR